MAFWSKLQPLGISCNIVGASADPGGLEACRLGMNIRRNELAHRSDKKKQTENHGADHKMGRETHRLTQMKMEDIVP